MPAEFNAILQQMILIVPLIAIVVWMFVSQKKRTKSVSNMLDNIKTGDRIKTIGGFYGKVLSVKEDVLTFECGPDKIKLVISKNAVANVEANETVNDADLDK